MALYYDTKPLKLTYVYNMLLAKNIDIKSLKEEMKKLKKEMSKLKRIKDK